MGDFLKNFSLEGKVAWITGASYGLGLAYAVAYAESGAKIVFNDINQELVDKGLAEYKKRGIEAYGAVCDVTNEEQVQKFVADVKEKVGSIDILVNNAGIIKRIPMTEMTVDQWNQVINVDLTGPFICSKAVLPDMIAKGSGKIINACSMMSELGRETVSAYLRCLQRISAQNMVSTTFSVMQLDLVTLQLLRQLLFVRNRLMVLCTHLTDSSDLRHQLRDGERQKTLWDLQYSLLLKLQTSSMVR